METKDLGKVIGILNNQIKRYLEVSSGVQDITGMRGRIMHFILGRGGVIYPKDIEEEFGMRRATVSRYLIAMEKSGIIDRLSVSEDKRVRKIVPTDKAFSMNDCVQADIRALEAKLASGLSQQEKSEFLRISALIEKNMKD